MSKAPQAPAPPDASFQTDTPQGRPPTAAEVEQRLHVQAQAQAIEQQMGLRDIQYAAMYEMTLEEWQATSSRGKELILQTAPHHYIPVGDRDFSTLPEIDARHGSAAQLSSQFERLRNQLISPEEEKEFVFLCDPVQDNPRWGLVTPGISRIRRDPSGQSIAKKIRQGFTYSPLAMFKPDPTAACGYPGLLEPVCPYKGYPDMDDPRRSTEVEIHQKAKHPREYAAREAALVRGEREASRTREQRAAERDEQQMEFMRLQTELMRQQLEQAKARKDE